MNYIADFGEANGLVIVLRKLWKQTDTENGEKDGS